MYFNLNSKLLPGKSTQKVNKQKIVVSIWDLYWLFVKRANNAKFDIHLTVQTVCSEKIVATLFDKFV